MGARKYVFACICFTTSCFLVLLARACKYTNKRISLCSTSSFSPFSPVLISAIRCSPCLSSSIYPLHLTPTRLFGTNDEDDTTLLIAPGGNAAPRTTGAPADALAFLESEELAALDAGSSRLRFLKEGGRGICEQTAYAWGMCVLVGVSVFV